jgi:hypothetical protein
MEGPEMEIRGPFEKFVDSPYYSESELCGGAVAVDSLQQASGEQWNRRFLASELPFHGWKRPEIAWGEIWII